MSLIETRSGRTARPQSVFALLVVLMAAFSQTASPGEASASGTELSAAQKAKLDANWKKSLEADKGPYSLNFCVCKDNKKKPSVLFSDDD